MAPTTRGTASQGDGGRTATRLTRRAANAAALAVVAFWALFVFSAELPAVRAHSPWAGDPYDAVVSFAALLVTLVAVFSFVRCQHWRGPASMPASAVRQVEGFEIPTNDRDGSSENLISGRERPTMLYAVVKTQVDKVSENRMSCVLGSSDQVEEEHDHGGGGAPAIADSSLQVSLPSWSGGHRRPPRRRSRAYPERPDGRRSCQASHYPGRTQFVYL
jgi:hypothetical protein